MLFRSGLIIIFGGQNLFKNGGGKGGSSGGPSGGSSGGGD